MNLIARGADPVHTPPTQPPFLDRRWPQQAIERLRRDFALLMEPLSQSEDGEPKEHLLVGGDGGFPRTEFAPMFVGPMRHGSLGGLIDEVRTQRAANAVPLVVTPHVSRSLGKKLRELSVCYLDHSGNAWLAAPGLRVLVSGQPPVASNQATRDLSGSDLRVLGLMLRDPAAGRDKLQDISRKAGVAVGAVAASHRRLQERGLLVRASRRDWRLIDSARALTEFATGWGGRIREKLNPRRYRPVPDSEGTDVVERLRRTASPPVCLLGGEAAAGLLTGFLASPAATLHCEKSSRDVVIRQLRMAPDPVGPITVLDRFGEQDQASRGASTDSSWPALAHPLLVWAECRLNPDERVQQTADLLREQLLRASSS